MDDYVTNDIPADFNIIMMLIIDFLMIVMFKFFLKTIIFVYNSLMFVLFYIHCCLGNC